MFEYEVMARIKMIEFRDQAASDHRAQLADQHAGGLSIGIIVGQIRHAFTVAYSLMTRSAQRRKLGVPSVSVKA